MKVKTISVKEIVPGMKAYGDVFNDLGLLIFNSGFVLKETSIAKLALYGVSTIKVQIPDDIKYESSDNGILEIETEYCNRIREKVEFKNFIKVYDENKQKTVENIDDIASGKEIHRENLIKITNNVTDKLSTNRDMFDFLNSILIDDVTYTHSLNVSILARAFASWVNLKPEMVYDIGIAGLLHDVGKTQIPPKILNKPGKLTDDEYQEIKKHPIYSYRLAQKQNFNEYILKGILMHHERYDGSGYPTGAKGKQIALFARILAIADVFEAMTSTRAYRSKVCPFKVLDILEMDSYTDFDPSIIGKILDNIANSYVGNIVELNTGQKGTIVFINRRVSRPIIEVNGSMFDLSKEDDEKIYIEEVL